MVDHSFAEKMATATALMHIEWRKKAANNDEQDMEATGDHVVVVPGQIISTQAGFLRGHGTYVENGKLVSSVAGVVEKVNQLISVRPLKSRYIGQVGDIVVGRVVDMYNKMWKVDVGAHQHAMLMLSSVNLPGGAQRRRTYEDQLQMRMFFQETDLISAEVQEVRYDGTLSLYTRSLRYGKLENGQFISVSPVLVKKLKQHVVALECGVTVILGNNGFIWIARTLKETADNEGDERAEALLEKKKLHAETPVTRQERIKIARIYACIALLNREFRMISPESIMALFVSASSAQALTSAK